MIKKSLSEAFDFIKNRGKLSEREAIRKFCESYYVEYETPTGEVKRYDAHTLRKKYIQSKKGIVTQLQKGEHGELKEGIIKRLKSGRHYTLEELSDIYDTGIGKIKTVLKLLQTDGYNIELGEGHAFVPQGVKKSAEKILDVKKMTTGYYRFGVCGDNHLCSKYSREDVLNSLYDYYEKEGITVVYNTGNWIDGEARFNRTDINTFGMGRQIDYFVEHYPKRKGITTYFISGDDHEGWYNQREGINIGQYAQMKAEAAGRNDLIHLGYMEADVIFKAKNGQTKLRVLHPGGGSSYAFSYTPQKIVESYTGGEKPDILLIGHYHKSGYNFIRGVHAVQTGTTQDQSPFMRKKRLAAHLGGCIIEFGTDDNGAVTRFKHEFIPFYDNEYYKKWDYLW